MMNLDTWKKFNESIAGGMTLGVSKPHTVGGLMGLHQEWDDEEDDDDEKGPDKKFPPESSDDMEDDDDDMEDDGMDTDNMGDDAIGQNFGEPENDDDFLASIGSGAGGKDINDAPELGDGDGDEDDFLASLHQGGEGEEHHAPDDNMDFLKDINPELAGFGQDDGANMHGEPCPDCNPNGDEDHGDPDCMSCNGEGFLDDMGGDDMGGDDMGKKPHDSKEMNAYMDKMLSYMKKYMKKESAQLSEFAPAMQPNNPAMTNPAMANNGMTQNQNGINQQRVSGQNIQQMPVNNMQQQQLLQQQQQQPMKRMVKFMSKGGERSFMAAEKFKKNMKNCESSCETTDFLNSLCDSAKGNKSKNFTGISEDSLLKAIDPNYESEPKAGEFGFSPQGRVGGIGGGYTKDDFKDIPVLGESRRYPTLAEYTAHKYKNLKNKNKK